MNLREWITDRAQRKALDLTTDEAREAYWRQLEAEREPFYSWAEGKVKAQFRREMADVLENGWVDEATSVTPTAPRIDEWTELIAKISRKVASEFARTTGARLKPAKSALHICRSGPFGSYVLGLDRHEHQPSCRVPQRKSLFTDLWQEYIEDYIARFVGERVVMILATTRDAIKATLREGILAGEGVYELSQRIEKLYLEEIIPHRSEVISRTEVLAASNHGAFASAKATAQAYGMQMRKTWVSTPDSRTRDWHRAAGGQTQPLDDPFIVGGEQLMYPGDSSLGASAANLIMCRCAHAFETIR